MSCGFLYVATGKAYLAEAMRSARSLRSAMPSARIALITDCPAGTETTALFDSVIAHPAPSHGPGDKLVCGTLSPYERTVFLDTDTLVQSDLSPLFDVLEHHDLAAAPETMRGWHYRLPDLPDAFPEYNTGVIAFRSSPRTAAFFSAWALSYQTLALTHRFKTDQPSFRHAAFFGDARIAPLPSEFHFIAFTPNYVMWRTHLLHGREDLERLAQVINAHPSPRAYVPGLGTLAAYQGRRHWLRQGLRLLKSWTRTFLYPPKAQSHGIPDHWSAKDGSPPRP